MAQYEISFRCYFFDGGVTNHHQLLCIDDIPIWIDSYKFTHPNCSSISVKIWFDK